VQDLGRTERFAHVAACYARQ